jgi:hypothetical protein
LRTIFKGLAFALAALFVLGAVATGSAIYLNRQAAQSARALCQAVPVGMSESEAVALGERQAERHLRSPDGHQFWFKGFVFGGALCELQVQAGQVRSVRVVGAPG